ncbi:MAG: hypothetical protein J5934_03275 [Succinivibrio sp.]|nr:hypothetical protein [Succinivibrio sp.]
MLTNSIAFIKKFSINVLAFTLLGLSSQYASAYDRTEIKVGVVGENNEYWQPIIDKLAAEGVKLELVKFATYPLPNRALEDGEIDLNAFQTGAFLKTEASENDYHLTAIGTTIIAPLGLYSKKIRAITDITDNSTLTIPSDPITTGRALRLLESAGFLKLKAEAGYLPGQSDILENPHNLQFFWVDAANAYGTLDDVTAAFINGGYAVDRGLTPDKDAIYIENTHGWGLENPFVNVIASREADSKNELFLHVVDLYHTKEVADIIKTTYKGAFIPAFNYK